MSSRSRSHASRPFLTAYDSDPPPVRPIRTPSEGTPTAWPDPVQRAVRRAHWHQHRTARRTAFVRAAKTGLASALVVLAAAVLALVPVADAFETAAPEPVAITLPEVTFYAEPSAVEAEAASAAAPAAVAAPDDAAQS